MRPSRAAPLTVATLLALTGCHAAVTEVVVVVDTDLSLPAQAETFELEIMSPRTGTTRVFGAPLNVGVDGGPPVTNGALPRFPATIGLVPLDSGGFGPFDVTAKLLHTPPGGRSEIVVERTATNVELVRGETRTLFLTLLRACVCAGTNCPTTIACGDLTAPTLTPFDPGHLPRVTSSDGGASTDGATDARADAAPRSDIAVDDHLETREDGLPDGPVDRGVEAAPEAPPADAPADAPKDTAPEAPTKYAQGHTCGVSSDCQNSACVDGFCCESNCTCGTCGGSAPGTCVPAAAGTDPHGACGMYTCDGAGACVTTCPEAFGACMTVCKAGSFCDGSGTCTPAPTGNGYCVVGTCTCAVGLTCQPRDAGGAGVCQ